MQCWIRRWIVREWRDAIIAAAAVSASVTYRLSGKSHRLNLLKCHAQMRCAAFARRARILGAMMSWKRIAHQLSYQRDETAAVAAASTAKHLISKAFLFWAAAAELGNRRYTMYQFACSHHHAGCVIDDAGLPHGSRCSQMLFNVSCSYFLPLHEV